MLTAAHAGDYLHPSPSAAWSERVQIVYDDATRSVERKRVRVWNPNPEKNLDFVWEPAPGAAIGRHRRGRRARRHGPPRLARPGFGELRSQDHLQHL